MINLVKNEKGRLVSCPSLGVVFVCRDEKEVRLVEDYNKKMEG